MARLEIKIAKPILIMKVGQDLLTPDQLKHAEKSLEDKLNNEYHVIVISHSDLKGITFEAVGFKEEISKAP